MPAVPIVESRTCVRCQRTDVSSSASPELRSVACAAPPRAPAGYTIDSIEITAVGVCARCQALALEIQQGA